MENAKLKSTDIDDSDEVGEGRVDKDDKHGAVDVHDSSLVHLQLQEDQAQ